MTSLGRWPALGGGYSSQLGRRGDRLTAALVVAFFLGAYTQIHILASSGEFLVLYAVSLFSGWVLPVRSVVARRRGFVETFVAIGAFLALHSTVNWIGSWSRPGEQVRASLQMLASLGACTGLALELIQMGRDWVGDCVGHPADRSL